MGQRKGEKNVGWQPETQPKGKPPAEKTKGAETMQRLIDADALKYEPLPKGDRNYRTYNLDDAYDDGYDDAFTDIRNAPTIDAVPVRHGKWIDKGLYANRRACHEWQCSECGEHVIEVDASLCNYCPNCGARMDKE